MSNFSCPVATAGGTTGTLNCRFTLCRVDGAIFVAPVRATGPPSFDSFGRTQSGPSLRQRKLSFGLFVDFGLISLNLVRACKESVTVQCAGDGCASHCCDTASTALVVTECALREQSVWMCNVALGGTYSYRCVSMGHILPDVRNCDIRTNFLYRRISTHARTHTHIHTHIHKHTYIHNTYIHTHTYIHT